jgi:hypothetical protein
LTFANAMHQLDAGDPDARIPEPFEAEHYVDPGFDVAMMLLDQVVMSCPPEQRVVLHFADRPVRCRVAVQRDRFWSAPLTLDGLGEEGFSRCNSTPGAEPEVNRLAGPINRTVEVGPLAPDLHVLLIDPPRLTAPVQIAREREERLIRRHIIMLKGLPSKQQAKQYL